VLAILFSSPAALFGSKHCSACALQMLLLKHASRRTGPRGVHVRKRFYGAKHK
jgi:hypothetical protein